MKPRARRWLASTLLLACAMSAVGSDVWAASSTLRKINDVPSEVDEAPSGSNLLEAVIEREAQNDWKPAVTKSSNRSAKISEAEARNRHLAALNLAFQGKTKKAVQALSKLSQVTKAGPELDRIYLSIGRIEYERGNFAQAVEAYESVDKGSASWLESIEERSIAQLRLGQPQEALAGLKTVLTPIFEKRILSEPFFVTALAELRVCDYKSVFKTLDLFKDRYREKVKMWEKQKTAKTDGLLRELRDTVQKLNLVEAEAIQRLYVEPSGKRLAGAPPKIDRSTDELTFPADADVDAREVWMDEIDGYKVTTKGCPTVNEAIPMARKE